MSKEDKRRKRRVMRTWQYFDWLAAHGPDGLRVLAREASEALEGKALEEQEDEVVRALVAIRAAFMPTARAIHAALSEVVGKSTGMTLDDYIWLRDYDPLDEEAS